MRAGGCPSRSSAAGCSCRRTASPFFAPAGQDTQRAFASALWERRSITRWGQELVLTGYLRGDVYHTSDALLDHDARSIAAPRAGRRAASPPPPPSCAGRWSGRSCGGLQTLTPRLQIVASPPTKNLSVPNEDARSVDLEDSNLFDLNRFPGYDRWEDGPRVTYGADWALDLPGVAVRTTIGQSYRLNSKPSILPPGTGLSDRFSDFVGRTTVQIGRKLEIVHRFRIDKSNLALRRNEIDAVVGGRRTYFTVGYLKLNRNINSIEDLPDREEIRLSGRLQIAHYWSIFGSTTIDLTSKKEDPLSVSDGFQPVRHRLGISYDDDCLELGLTWRRDYDASTALRRGNTFMFRVALKIERRAGESQHLEAVGAGDALQSRARLVLVLHERPHAVAEVQQHLDAAAVRRPRRARQVPHGLAARDPVDHDLEVEITVRRAAQAEGRQHRPLLLRRQERLVAAAFGGRRGQHVGQAREVARGRLGAQRVGGQVLHDGRLGSAGDGRGVARDRLAHGRGGRSALLPPRSGRDGRGAGSGHVAGRCRTSAPARCGARAPPGRRPPPRRRRPARPPRERVRQPQRGPSPCGRLRAGAHGSSGGIVVTFARRSFTMSLHRRAASGSCGSTCSPWHAARASRSSATLGGGSPRGYPFDPGLRVAALDGAEQSGVEPREVRLGDAAQPVGRGPRARGSRSGAGTRAGARAPRSS